MSNGHISAMFMALMRWRLIKRPLTSKCISNKAVLVRWSIPTTYIVNHIVPYFYNTQPTLTDLSYKGLKEHLSGVVLLQKRCSIFLCDQHFTHLIFLLRAAVPSLVQHLFAFASAALSACSHSTPLLSYDHASIMSRNSNPVEHTSFPARQWPWGGSREGVKYSTAWSDLASLQRVMKQLHRSATYTPISLPNERMSRAQVKNELAERSPLRGKKWDPFPLQNSPHPHLLLSPPPPNSDFSGDDWLNWKQPPFPLQTPIPSCCISN